MCHNTGMLATKAQVRAFVGLFRRGTKLAYKKGEFIIRPGETPNGVFFIKSGLVKAYNITKYGEENLLIIRKENEIFPLIWGVTGQDRDIIYEALSPVEVWRISPKDYLKELGKHPDSVAVVLDMVLEMYRIHSERIINLQYRSVRERLISFLLFMSQRFGKKTNKGLVIQAPLKHQDIASSINATRETTGRELAGLQRRGLIKSEQSIITLKKVSNLKSYL